MTTDLAEATAEYRAAQQALTDAKAAVPAARGRLQHAREVLLESVVAAARAGTRMRDLVATTGLNREYLRTILRNAGVEPD